MNKNKEKYNSINEALSVLDQAVSEGSQEIKDIIMSDYQNLKKIVEGTSPQIKATLKGLGEKSKEALGHTKDSVLEFSNRTMKNIDRSAHANPWRILSGVAAATTLIGFWMGRKMMK